MSRYDENRAGREWSDRKRKGCVVRWIFFVLGPLFVGDNMMNSPDNHISPPYMICIWGRLNCLAGLILGCRLGTHLMSKHLRTWEGYMSFTVGDNLNYLFDSLVARSNARAFY